MSRLRRHEALIVAYATYYRSPHHIRLKMMNSLTIANHFTQDEIEGNRAQWFNNAQVVFRDKFVRTQRMCKNMTKR